MRNRLPRILLVDPPIYDFAAYDFWMKPLGILAIGGQLRHAAHIELFDYMDRLSPCVPPVTRRPNSWGRGHFHAEDVAKPPALAKVSRRYRRFGLPRAIFREFLSRAEPFDFALIGTGMTYWYPGVAEVIEDLRARSYATRIVLGGVYATLATAHARSLGADLVVVGHDLAPLWSFLDLAPDLAAPPLWEGYARLEAGALKLTDGCPFACTYCSVPLVGPRFAARPRAQVRAAFAALASRGVRNIAFYDDALLFHADEILLPFLADARARETGIAFHTPNALNARFITPQIAGALSAGGFATFYLGLENASNAWQAAMGGKVKREEFAAAVEYLCAAGVPGAQITAYVLLGHPRSSVEEVEDSLRVAHGLGIRAMLADFSPIPGTPDAAACARIAPLEEPLWHNKTAFTLRALGADAVNRLKQRCRDLNAAQA